MQLFELQQGGGDRQRGFCRCAAQKSNKGAIDHAVLGAHCTNYDTRQQSSPKIFNRSPSACTWPDITLALQSLKMDSVKEANKLDQEGYKRKQAEQEVAIVQVSPLSKMRC